ncbi:unnamed protein product, partial [Amoebophrya sp. A25]
WVDYDKSNFVTRLLMREYSSSPFAQRHVNIRDAGSSKKHGDGSSSPLQHSSTGGHREPPSSTGKDHLFRGDGDRDQSSG